MVAQLAFDPNIITTISICACIVNQAWCQLAMACIWLLAPLGRISKSENIFLTKPEHNVQINK